MKKLLLLLLLSLGCISSANAAVPEFTGQNTIVDFCKKINCHDQLKEFYKQYYFSQTFSKALVISYYKSGNEYINDYFGYSFKEKNTAEAKNKAMRMCKKHGKKCELLLLNNKIQNKELYELLTKTTSSSSYITSSSSSKNSSSYITSSSSSNKIPANAHADGNSWTCNTNYYRNSSLKGCLKVPANASSSWSSNYWSCNSGYKKKNGNSCVITIPSNAYASDDGWKCNSGYYQNNNYCTRLPSNAIARSNGDGFYCKTNYRKSTTQNKCVKKLNIPSNAYASGDGWKCNSGYYKSGSSCIKLPAYAIAAPYDDGFLCKSGYTKSENYCIDVPDNAYASGSSWKCNSGFIQSGNSCVTVTNIADNTFEVKFWDSIEDSEDPEEFRIYLEEFPEGKFVKLAELRIEKLGDTSGTVAQVSTPIPNLDYGNYHALVIGNDRYRHLQPLSNAVNDANDVASLLRSKYGFNVDVLTNATRDAIVSKLSELRTQISSKDNLLVYYAGHGVLDEDMGEGFWLPVDAVDDNQVDWIANSTIVNSVRAMKAKHVMVVADSCFSGTLTRGVNIKKLSPDYLKEIVEKKARMVLTSGGEEPVSDVGGGNNSVFAAAFMRILNENTGVMDGHRLFTTLKEQVMGNSLQTPEYGLIRNSGHDGGDFLFVRQ